MKFASFMSRPVGRILRVVVGAALVGAGVVLGSTLGIVLGVVGAVVFAAGALNWCLIAPLLRLPVAGSKIRAREAGTRA